MTDWAQLSHAYGSAEDIPVLLDQIASEPIPEYWSNLWSALCHQGSVYSASFAALPWLADVAGRDDREQAVSALNLVGAILAGSDQPHGAGDVRAQHAAEIEPLLVVANEHLRASSDRNEYAYLLESMLSFEGVVGWGEDLAWGLVNEEYESPALAAKPPCSSSSASADSSPRAVTTRCRRMTSRPRPCIPPAPRPWMPSAAGSATSPSSTGTKTSPAR
ncbi:MULTISPECIES: hypothetical protein [unclassified Streptomyces]|uniref:hypothetical protein n=1 Tax=unclassified Streptomyces TaxID=2593676 RepID=UPI003815CA59